MESARDKAFASIHGHKLKVTGSPEDCWQVRPAGIGDTAGKELLFDIAIIVDEYEELLVRYESQNKEYSATDRYRTLDEAIVSAEQRFGINRDQWLPDYYTLVERTALCVEMLEAVANPPEGAEVRKLFEQLALSWDKGRPILMDLLRHGFAKFKFGNMTTSLRSWPSI